jgi:RNA polymerase sigma-70 factor (ECF subfamily)
MNSSPEDRFQSLIKKNKGIIYKVANSYCRDKEDRKDLIQEIIIQIWKSFGRYDEQYKFSTWMYRIALNVAISFIRKETRRKDYAQKLDDSIIDVADENTIPETEEKFKQLRLFIDQLDELNKALMILYLDEHSHKEIATILGLTETNVATKINRIKEKLRVQFLNIQTK